MEAACRNLGGERRQDGGERAAPQRSRASNASLAQGPVGRGPEPPRRRGRRPSRPAARGRDPRSEHRDRVDVERHPDGAVERVADPVQGRDDRAEGAAIAGAEQHPEAVAASQAGERRGGGPEHVDPAGVSQATYGIAYDDGDKESHARRENIRSLP